METFTCPNCNGKGITLLAALYGGDVCKHCNGYGHTDGTVLTHGFTAPRTDGTFASIGVAQNGLLVEIGSHHTVGAAIAKVKASTLRGINPAADGEKPALANEVSSIDLQSETALIMALYA